MAIGEVQGPASTVVTSAVTPAQHDARQAAPAASQQPQAPGSPVTGSTAVELSSTVSSLRRSDGAEFNTAKVEQMREAIAGGNFRVNAEAIADKMLANAQELLGGSAQ